MADAWKLDESAVLAVREGGPVGPRQETCETYLALNVGEKKEKNA